MSVAPWQSGCKAKDGHTQRQLNSNNYGVLRRAENCGLSFKKNLLGAKGRVTVRVGSEFYPLPRKITRTDFYAARDYQLSYPVLVVRIQDRRYWQFQDYFYWDNDGLSAEEVHALLVTRKQRDRARIERAQAMVTQGFANSGAQRGSIPDDLKQFIWTRDGGQCRSCGTTTELQFDHVIPVTLGGGSSAENLQILCGPCNRRKGVRLTTS